MVGSAVMKFLPSPDHLWGPSFLFQLSGFFSIVCHLIPTWSYHLPIVSSPFTRALPLVMGSKRSGPI